ncbi:MAG: CHRD domain-containing protein [Phycisphaeraceae bacterium]|nr:CHRD domain-containing protein [Phycisphaeraceae bacterium]
MGSIRSSRAASAAAVVCALGGTGVASADIFVYTATLNGANEFPPVVTPGTGTSTVTVDTNLNTMRVEAAFQDLIGTVTVAHIHAPTAVAFTGSASPASPTPSFPGFPSGGTSGSYDMTFDMTLASSYSAAFITNNGGTVASARSVLFDALGNGKAYINVHSTFAGGGEIRGFYVPAPAGLGLLAGAGLLARRRR